ncbi:MAG: DUF2269 family protein [Solirubrobacteraceae bacterium]
MSAILAVSAQVPGDLSFYNLVVFVHIASALVGLGSIFSYPAFYRIGMSSHPRGLPFFHRVQGFIGSRTIPGGLAMLLITGVYMAAAGPFDFGDPFVGVGILVVVVVGALGGLYFSRQEPRLEQLAERDIAAAGGGEVRLSQEYVDLARQAELIGLLSAGLVLVTLLFMVLKPGT